MKRPLTGQTTLAGRMRQLSRTARRIGAWMRAQLGRLLVAWCLWLALTCPPLAKVVEWCCRTGHRLAARVATGARRVLVWPNWHRIAQLISYTGSVVRRAVTPVTRPALLVWRAWWRWAEPWIRDAAGWLVHRSPRAAGRLLVGGVIGVWCGGWWVLRHAAVGTGWMLARLLPYLVGYTDFHGVLAEAIDEKDATRAKRLREQWRKAARRRLSTAALLLAGVTTGVALLHARYGLLAVAAAAAGLVVVLAVLATVGRVVQGRQARTLEEAAKAEGEPFPIADAHTRKEAVDAVTRAVKAEGIELRGTGEALRQPWGWQVPVILKRGTPADLIARLGELETTLDLPEGGALAAPDRSRRARVVLRLAQRDPFANIDPAVHREPASVSIVDQHVIGQRIDGIDLALCLLGVHAVVIGVPGAGKSITLRTLADVVSACRDAIAWDLDPAGSGLDILGGGIARRERDPAGIEDALTDAVSYALARPHLLDPLGMGDAWRPSPTHPALVVFVDEYPRLTDRAKALAVELLRIGRKARITLVLAASEATADALGATMAETVAVKVLLPCRHTDIRLVLGQGMGAKGWRPDRLHPESGESPEDAGKVYVYAAGSREPVISKIRKLERQRAWDNGAHRAAHGLPMIDRDTLNTARTRRPTITGTSASDAVPIAVDRQAVVDMITVFDGNPKLWTEHILTRLSTIDERYQGWTGETLSATLRPLGIAPGQVRIGDRNRNGYYLHTITDAWHSYRLTGGRHD